MISSELELAYRATTYEVHDVCGDFIIRIGEVPHGLDEVLVGLGYGSWAFVTPCNPYSNQLPDKVNERRLDEAGQVLAGLGYEFWRGYGKCSSGDWPAEPSFLVPGVSREQAFELGVRWEQNAVVFGDVGHPTELLWCLANP